MWGGGEECTACRSVCWTSKRPWAVRNRMGFRTESLKDKQMSQRARRRRFTYRKKRGNILQSRGGKKWEAVQKKEGG